MIKHIVVWRISDAVDKEKTAQIIKENLEALKEKIRLFAGQADINTEDIIVSARQYGAIERAIENIDDALTALNGFTQDIAGECIERAISALGEIDGRTATQEIVNEIFSHFCVGK